VWAITSYYNPARFKRRLPNYRIFRENLGIPLVTVEQSFDGTFELTPEDADVLIQISGGAVLWQKERLLNLALKSVPANEQYVAWIDCDVLFERPDWAEEATRQLAHSQALQLLSHQVDLKPEDHYSNFDYKGTPASGLGIVHMVRESGESVLPAPGQNRRSFAWGLAWAARRELLERHGLYDGMIVGGGTRAVVNAMYGEFDNIAATFKFNEPYLEHYMNWAEPFSRDVGGKIGHVEGRLYHLWHGHLENRNYANRYQELANFNFQPSDIFIGANGAWHWSKPKPALEEYLLSHFIKRAEDG